MTSHRITIIFDTGSDGDILPLDWLYFTDIMES